MAQSPNMPDFYNKLISTPVVGVVKGDTYLDEISQKTKKIIALAENYFKNVLITKINEVYKNSENITETSDINTDDIKNNIKKDFDKKDTVIKEQVQKEKTNSEKLICNTLNSFYGKIKNVFKNSYSLVDNIFESDTYKKYEELHSKLSKFIGKSFSLFFDNTIGKVFSWFGKYGDMIYSFLKNSVIYVYKFFDWMVSSAFKIISFVYDTFVNLAKIGWKVITNVFDYLTSPIKEVGSYFVDAFKFILETPIGFVLAVGGFIFAIRTVLPLITKALTSIFESAWGWVEQKVADIFFKGDKTALENYVSDYYKKITEYLNKFGNKIVEFYDNNISQYLGNYKFEDIKKWFSSDGIIITTINNIIHTLIPNISLIIEDFQITWNFAKLIYTKFKNIFSSTDSGYKSSEQELAYKAENSKILNNYSKDIYSEQLNLILYEEIFKEHIKSNITDIKQSVEYLTKYGNTVLSDHKKSIIDSFTNKENITKILNSFDVNIKSIVSGIVLTSKETNESIIKSSKYKLLENSLKTTDISKTLELDLNKNSKLIHENLEEYSSLTYKQKIEDSVTKLSTELTNNIINDTNKFSSSVLETLKNVNTSFKNFNNENNQVVGDFNKLFEKNKNNITNLEKAKSELDQLNIKLKVLQTEKTPYETGDWFKNGPIWQGSVMTTYVDEKQKIILDLQNKIQDIQNKIKTNSFEYGGVVKKPIHAIIGEGTSPEIIVPLNESGINFIMDSMKDVLLDSKYEDTSNVKENDKNAIIRRIGGKSAKPDIALYDMKNISSGFIGSIK